MLNGKNILITGISGFLGSSLARSLTDLGANVYGIVRDKTENLDNRRVKLIKGEIQDFALLRKTVEDNQIEICFHLAAKSIVSNCEKIPLEVFETNIKGTWNVLEACRHGKQIKAILIASSSLIWGEPKSLLFEEGRYMGGFTETTGPYVLSKLCSELLANSYYSYYKIPVGISRFTNLYGPGDYNYSRLIPGTIRSVIQGEKPQIRGDGKSLRDYVFIEDAVEGYLLFAQALLSGRLLGETIDFGTGLSYSVAEIIDKILHIFRKDFRNKMQIHNIRKEAVSMYPNNTKAAALLRWEPKYSITEGLERSVEWYVSKSGIR